jgi:TerC family integral membrane protein
MSELAATGLFTLLVLGLLTLDLGVFHRRAHVISMREAALWSAFWVAVSLSFALFVYYWRGSQPALEFLAGYILEKSLSMDNVMVFAVIFSSAAVPPRNQYKLLYWGILGALIMRGAFIIVGAALILRFHWILYGFGAFLVFTGIRLLRREKPGLRLDRNPVLRWARRLFVFTDDFEGSAFFVRREKKWFATPMLLVLVMIETLDVLFAVDSIPAVFAVTSDAFIVYTSNILAILGLRALYFVLAGAMIRFRYLRVGLSIVLLFVGTKMLLLHFYRVPIVVSLLVICGILGVAILASLGKMNPDASETARDIR